MNQHLKTENVKGLCCRVDEQQWQELVRVADEMSLRVCLVSRRTGTKHLLPNKSCGFAMIDKEIGLWTLEDSDGNAVIPYEEFLTKLKGESQPTTPFAEQVAANIIKISCNIHTPYAEKMKMVAQAILEFERDPKNKQPK